MKSSRWLFLSFMVVIVEGGRDKNLEIREPLKSCLTNPKSLSWAQKFNIMISCGN